MREGSGGTASGCTGQEPAPRSHPRGAVGRGHRRAGVGRGRVPVVALPVPPCFSGVGSVNRLLLSLAPVH